MKIVRNMLIVAVTAVSLSACNMPDPCTELGPPSGVERQAAAGDAEVEREVRGTECVVVNDRWVNGTSVEG